MERNASIIIRSGEGVSRVRGTWAQTENGWLLAYDEPAAAELGTARTELLLSGGRLEMTRRGSVRASFCFDPRAPHASLYETAWGGFRAEIVTHALRVRVGARGGLIELRYTLTLGGAVSARALKLLIRTEESQ